MTASELTGVRASNLVGCLRKGWFDGMDYEKEELSKRTKNLFRIREMQNDALALADAEEARALDREIVLEQDIPWGPKTPAKPNGIWTAHADFADWTDHVVREYTGSADLSPDRRKMLQSAFYAKRMTELTGHEWGAWVKVFNPSTGEERFVPINWRAIVWEIDVLIADLEAHLASGEMPDRVDSEGETVCSNPHDGPTMFCPYAGACFRGWEYPTMGRLEGKIAQDVARAHTLSERANVKLIEADLKPLKKQIAAGLLPKAKYIVPLKDGRSIEASYSEIPGRVTVSLKEFEEAGFKIPPELEPFIKRGEPTTRLVTKMLEARSEGE